MPLTSRCRHCGYLSQVYAQELRARRGKIQCPKCRRRFDAIANLLDESVPASNARDYGPAATGFAAKPAAAVSLWRARRRSSILEWDAAPGHSPRASAILWSLGILVLIAGLLAQIAWWDRGEWLNRPGVQAAVQALCQDLGCRLALPRIAASMSIRQPVLSEGEHAAGSLRLTLLVVNESEIVQRLPRLQLQLYDETGGLLGARRFEPQEYMPQAAERFGLAPGESIQPVLDLAALPTPATGFRVLLF